MNIGITFDSIEEYLRAGVSRETAAEFDREETIEAIATALRDLGHTPDIIGNIRSLVKRLATGDRGDLVFNIAEGLKGFGREAQVPALLDAYDIPYTFSDPLALAITLHKGMAKHVIRDLGISTPDFAVVHTPDDAKHVHLIRPLFVKPVAEGTSKGVTPASRVNDTRALVARCARIITSFGQPALVETYLPGREFTAGILGTGDKAFCFGVLEVLVHDKADRGIYTFKSKERYLERVTYRVAGDDASRGAAVIALQAWRGLGCRDAGRVDVREDGAGNPNIIDINPLAGLHPVHSDLSILAAKTGMSYRNLIAVILESALERVHRPATAAAS
ncbi:MAG TPA: D-alanine--D-alanine ligase [Deltaproteobacteria bacterium]|nr:D-alanine--D-alanine ligase [Deltaproteobacteria bacterium]